ncbi:TetR/AcrR family transcriptional regulator [Xanthobacter sediminis]|uniref:TetR/AcrR family transcriptional regulator n=1 Tax=Xanthobacter sediminis TaxID=3119926 RepID=UPI0037285627
MTHPASPEPSPQEGHRRASIGARRNPEAEAAILEAARGLLAERGYAGFSIEEVARRAGAGKPTIYRWWPTKADLFIDVYSAEKSAALVPPETGALWSDLLAYTRALWAFWRDTPSGRTFRALIAEAQASETAMIALRDKFLPERLKDVRRMFDAAASRGDVRAEAVPHLLTLYIGFNWVRLLTDRIADDPEGIETVARTLAGAPQ